MLGRRGVALVQHRGKALEHVRDAGGDVQSDGHLVHCGPAGQAKRVAEQDLVRTHFDQERWEPAEIGEDRADLRVSGIRAVDVVGHPETEPLRREDRIDSLILEQRVAGQGQVCVGRHQEGAARQGCAGVSQREEGGHRQPSTGRLARERDLAGIDALCGSPSYAARASSTAAGYGCSGASR